MNVYTRHPKQNKVFIRHQQKSGLDVNPDTGEIIKYKNIIPKDETKVRKLVKKLDL